MLLLQAHQWFGDLVTLGDWTQLWLNEGFATYFEVVAADAYRPTWGYFDTFLPSTTSPGKQQCSAHSFLTCFVVNSVQQCAPRR